MDMDFAGFPAEGKWCGAQVDTRVDSDQECTQSEWLFQNEQIFQLFSSFAVWINESYVLYFEFF